MFINIKTVKFSIVDSLNPKYVEVLASFTYDGKMCHHYIFITKRSDYKDKDYLIEARKIFLGDVKRNRINVKKKVSPVLIGAASFFAVATLALAGVLTYQYLKPGDNPGPQPEPEPTGDIELVLDEESLKDVTLEPSTANKGEDYVGTLTMKENNKAIDLSHSSIMVGDQELLFNRDFTVESKTTSNGNYQYTLNIDSSVMNGNLSLHMPSGNVDDFKITEEQYKKMSDLVLKTPNIRTIYSQGTYNPYKSDIYFVYTYSELVANLYRESNGTFKDEVYTRNSTSEENANIYYRDRTKMYEYMTDMEDPFPTISISNMLYLTFNSFISKTEYTQLTYNETTLSYEFLNTQQNVSVNLSVYQGYPTSFSLLPTKQTGEGKQIIGNFFYNFKKPVAPNESNSYVLSKSPYTSVTSETWNNLLTLDDSENLIYSYAFGGGEPNFCQHIYNKDMYFERDSNNNNYSYFKKDGDNYTKYTFDIAAGSWKKQTIEKKMYDEYSYDTIKNLITDVRDHKDAFEYDDEDDWYTSNSYLPGETFVVSFSKFTSIDKSQSEIIVDTLGCKPVPKATIPTFYDIAPHFATKLTLPEVK